MHCFTLFALGPIHNAPAAGKLLSLGRKVAFRRSGPAFSPTVINYYRDLFLLPAAIAFRADVSGQWLRGAFPVSPSPSTLSGTLMVASVRSLERRDRVDDFICGHDGTGVGWEVDVERDVHLLRVIRDRVFLPPGPS